MLSTSVFKYTDKWQKKFKRSSERDQKFSEQHQKLEALEYKGSMNIYLI